MSKWRMRQGVICLLINKFFYLSHKVYLFIHLVFFSWRLCRRCETMTPKSDERWSSGAHSARFSTYDCFLFLLMFISHYIFYCAPKKSPCLTLFYFTQIKLQWRDRVSVREIALEKKGEQTRDNNETQSNNETRSDSETLLGEKKQGKTRGGGGGGRRGDIIEERERELSQIESVCLGWY